VLVIFVSVVAAVLPIRAAAHRLLPIMGRDAGRLQSRFEWACRRGPAAAGASRDSRARHSRILHRVTVDRRGP